MFFAYFIIFSFSSNENCIFYIGNNFVDLSNLKIANNNFHYKDPDYGNFSFRLCGDLIQDSTVPRCGIEKKGWSGAANSLNALGVVQCYQTAATDSFVTSNIGNKFTIEFGSDTDSEPTSIDEVHTIYEFTYEKGAIPNDPYEVVIDDANKNRIITLKFNLDYEFQPIKPTPTPMFNPEYVKKSTSKPGLGIRFNLSEFSKLETTFVKDQENIEVQFSPGEMINCPFPYNCLHYTPSSLFICHAGKMISGYSTDDIEDDIEEKGYCSTFGVTNSQTSFDQEGISETDGVYVNYNSNDQPKSARVYFKCDENLRPHELKLGSTPRREDNQIEFTVRTYDTCIRTATPVPDPARRYCRSTVKIHGKEMIVDLRDFASPTGYVSTGGKITDSKSGKVIESDVSFFIHPCGLLGCPSTFSCPQNSNEDGQTSSFWKCSGSTGKCESIGSITASDVVFDSDESVDGTVVHFGSSLFGTKNATIEYVCNKKADTPIIENNATFDSENFVYKIRIQQKQFCTSEDDSDTGGKNRKNKGLTGGAIFLIVVGVAISLYLIIGITVASMREGKITFPNQAFWSEFALCIKEACVHICSCGKSDMQMKSTYDKI